MAITHDASPLAFIVRWRRVDLGRPRSAERRVAV